MSVVNSWNEWDPLREVIVERHEGPMIGLMRSLGCVVITCPFDRVYPFGGGFHCCTADVRREGALQSYFPTLDNVGGL
jgi:glycine amidinotransferase